MGLWAQIEELKSANKRLGAEIDRLRGERLVAYLAMRHVTIPDGQEPEGAVAALVEATRKYTEWLRAGEGSILDGIALAGNTDAALARFEVDTEPAD